MIPKRVVLENFLSFGSPATEIVFGDDESLWVLGGPNGVGKSAVFDAITYALFGCHRGGEGRGMEDLIRHGANGFRVVFEFEFNGAAYRITRTYSRKGNPTQRVEQRAPDSETWKPVDHVNSVAEVKEWSERTLGLRFDAFTASVLLRQGEADEIITATGGRRLDILKKIIGVERYEALSNRVHDAARTRKKKHEDLCTEMRQLTPDGEAPPTEADLRAARAAQDEAEKGREAAHQLAAVAARRVGDAKRWATLEGSKKALADKIREAEERATGAGRIRTSKARLDDLTKVIPVLRDVVAQTGQAAREEGGASWLREQLRTSPQELEKRLASIRDLARTEAGKAKLAGE
jgi:DNA repair exonuclease SbcCD ATPase subunit